mmetsp:Transcript_9015/g.13370  ORF Transcript_9015/g.13370 Transcript_9015/m.13370 type:complete len:532 (+) Transcript_9015:177-1772(+)
MTSIEFDTNITEKEKRIRARQTRIQQRIEPDKNEDGSKLQQANIARGFQRLDSEQQIADSLSLIDSKKAAGIINLTEVRVKADHRENARRIKEENRRYNRLQLLEKEKTDSTSSCENIAQGWHGVSDAKSAHELHRLINDQNERCTSLLTKKDDVIKEFQHELKQKDEEYVTSLKDQTIEIDKLQNIMTEEYQNMQRAYSVELEAIEEAFVQDRQKLIQTNKKELDDLFEKVSSIEAMQIQIEQRRRELSKDEIGKNQMEGLEEYNTLKSKLESDVQKLECKLEDARAMYQLNSDSLEYNLRVLSEKDVENEITIKKQKKRILKSKEELNRSTEKEVEQGVHNQKKNNSLEEDCLRIEKQYSGLKSKFQRFLSVYRQKYIAVLAMHKEEISDMVQRAKQAEEIINSQLLGDCEQITKIQNALQVEGHADQNYIEKMADDIPGVSMDQQNPDEGILVEISDIITDDIFDLWQQLEKMMINYNKILEERAKGVDCVKYLHDENNRLQEKLNQNYQNKINQELIIPPSRGEVLE